MNTTERLALPDIQAMLRLCNRLHESEREPTPRKRRLLEAVCALTGADCASTAVANFEPGARGPSLISIVEAGGDDGSLQRAGHAGVLASAAEAPPWQEFRRLRPRDARGMIGAPGEFGEIAGVAWCAPAPRARGSSADGRYAGHAVHSFLPLLHAGGGIVGGIGGNRGDGLAVVACLTVRRTPDRPRFSRRDRAIICVLHAESEWVYRGDVMLASPETRSLSPRQRQTLQHLLAGQGEKQIAADMGLSVNTIHHYIKVLYRHFGVSSRSELLARWVGR